MGLPLYWLNEPGRQTGAIENFDQTFVNRGARLFAPTEEGGYNCAGCHGSEGVGGQAPPYTLTDADGEFVATVTWRAPALNTVLLRFSVEELREILVYGRPGTPMPAWGTEGGGPLTTQQIDELIAYIGSIQLTSDEAKAEVEGEVRKRAGPRRGRRDRLGRSGHRQGALQPRAWRTASPAARTRAPAATRRGRRSSTAPSSRRTPTSATTPGSPTARAPSAGRSPAA